jgi:hypothetical protein
MLLFDATVAMARKPPHLSPHPTITQKISTPIRPMPTIMLPKRQQPTRPLPRTRARHLVVPLATHRRHRRDIGSSNSTAIQLRKRHRPRRHGIRRISAPRRGRGLGQVEENLAVHVALFVARHGLRPVFGQLLHFDVVGAQRALVLGGDGGVDRVDEVDAVEGAVGRGVVSGLDLILFSRDDSNLHHRARHAEAGARLHAEALV